MSVAASRSGPLVSDVAKASIGVAGLAACIALLFLGMRAVMDIGGACAEGGPYVPRVSCPDGAPAAMILGIFGLFLFGGIAMVYGSRIGGIWSAVPLLAWSGLFLSLGWNFLDYGIINPPFDEDVIWGWVICGVVFVAMGAGPLFLGFSVFGDAVVGSRRTPPRGPVSPNGTFPIGPAAADDADRALAILRAMASPEADAEVARRAALRDLATDMGSVVNEAVNESIDDAPADPLARAASSVEPGFSEGTQALLDRLERLADLRDRGLLAADEYEAAKDAIVKELEGRS